MEIASQRGAAVVEFALVLPLLLIMLFGIVEFGLLFYNKQVLTNASREGARAGIAHQEEDVIKKIVVDYCAGRIIPDSEEVPEPTVNGALGTYGQDLTVAVSYDYTFLLPGLLGFGPNLELTAQTVMKMESVASP